MRCREFLLSHRLLNKHIWKKKGIAAQCLINRLKLEDTTKTSISTHMIDSIHMTGNNLTAVSILMTDSIPLFQTLQWIIQIQMENGDIEKRKCFIRKDKKKFCVNKKRKTEKTTSKYIMQRKSSLFHCWCWNHILLVDSTPWNICHAFEKICFPFKR